MNKVYVLPPQEDWIVDRMVKEWNEGNPDMAVFTPKNADVVWLLADWCWQGLWHVGLLKGKKVLTTVHHIVPEKFGDLERSDFELRDEITTAYHVFNQHTYDFIRPLTLKPIHLVKYWANQHLWRPTGTKEELRKKLGLPQDAFLVGSFQRDTEGKGIPQGLFLPKLEKGPDKLADYLETLKDFCSQNRDFDPRPLHVALAGWRRQYIMQRLDDAKIRYTFFDRPPIETINELYQCLDQYAVTARQEGGPQALIECGLLGVPTVSTPVGIAEQVLPPSAICDNVFSASPAVPNVEEWKLPAGFQPYRELLESL
jgi:hypothetical protein